MSEVKFDIIVKDIILNLNKIAGGDLESTILYGSYARVNYNKESDFDVTVLLTCSPMEMKRYNDLLAELMVVLNLEHDILVSFCCIPYLEFVEKKDLLPFYFYMNIDREEVNLIA